MTLSLKNIKKYHFPCKSTEITAPQLFWLKTSLFNTSLSNVKIAKMFTTTILEIPEKSILEKHSSCTTLFVWRSQQVNSITLNSEQLCSTSSHFQDCCFYFRPRNGFLSQKDDTFRKKYLMPHTCLSSTSSFLTCSIPQDLTP